MSDRSSAEIFRRFFKELAEVPDERNRELARKIANLSLSFDFNACQMDCAEALCALGLARLSTPSEMAQEGATEPFVVDYEQDRSLLGSEGAA